MASYYVPYFAQYGCGTYGDNNYNSCTTSTSSSDGGSQLSDTGQGALTGIVVGSVLVAIALAMLVHKIIKKSKNKKK